MLNFGRYLDRLGIKARVQPVLLQTVQPVALVSDLSTLVAPALRPSGIVGCLQASTLATDFPAFQVVTPVPLRVNVQCSTTVATNVAIAIAQAPAFALVAPTVLTPQPFADFAALGESFESTWSRGTVLVASAPSVNLPRIRVYTANGASTGDLFIPGGWSMTLIHDNSGGQNATFAATFYELPSENPA